LEAVVRVSGCRVRDAMEADEPEGFAPSVVTLESLLRLLVWDSDVIATGAGIDVIMIAPPTVPLGATSITVSTRDCVVWGLFENDIEGNCDGAEMVGKVRMLGIGGIFHGFDEELKICLPVTCK
jgi:hypothetical protein